MSGVESDRSDPARDWLAERPDFELRSAAEQAAAQFPLERPAALLERLGRPDRAFRIVLVAGTKGKGSTAVFIASILQAHGLRVGLYSQPHLHTFRERLRIDGELISSAELADGIEQIRPIVEALDAERTELGRLTTYEIVTMLGLHWFARRSVDWVVLEVGLGGRLDATNVVTPDVAVITPISYDHTHVLGRRLGQIAAEKAGIIKPGGLVVSAPQRWAALDAIRRAARQRQATLTIVGQRGGRLDLDRRETLRMPAGRSRVAPQAPFFIADASSDRHHYAGLEIFLGGEHQLVNLATALLALESAEHRGLALDEGAVTRGVATARWPGRLEIAAGAPLVVLDGAHNGDSAERLAAALTLHFEYDRLRLVLGVFADKDLASIVRPLKAARVFAVQVPAERALPAELVALIAGRFGAEATVAGKVGDGLRQAIDGAGPNDLVCVTGSLAVVAAAREALGLAKRVT